LGPKGGLPPGCAYNKIGGGEWEVESSGLSGAFTSPSISRVGGNFFKGGVDRVTPKDTTCWLQERKVQSFSKKKQKGRKRDNRKVGLEAEVDVFRETGENGDAAKVSSRERKEPVEGGEWEKNEKRKKNALHTPIGIHPFFARGANGSDKGGGQRPS